MAAIEIQNEPRKAEIEIGREGFHRQRLQIAVGWGIGACPSAFASLSSHLSVQTRLCWEAVKRNGAKQCPASEQFRSTESRAGSEGNDNRSAARARKAMPGEQIARAN